MKKKSVDLLNEYTQIPENIRQKCSEIIMDTAKHTIPSDSLSKDFWLIDRNILFQDLGKLIEYEHQIFKEFQFLPYDVYKENRIKFLYSCIGVYGESVDINLKGLISYIINRKINVGCYCGTFNPAHLGHINIIEKSNKIFDKVIIAYGNNPEKEKRTISIPDCLNFYQVDSYYTLITDYIDSIEKPDINVTLIRGIRNGADLSYESNQMAFINDIKPNINVVYIPCDKQFEHISSSAIRNLMMFDTELIKKYLYSYINKK
jgi:pantetheine-phosphate adenylyltransferase